MSKVSLIVHLNANYKIDPFNPSVGDFGDHELFILKRLNSKCTERYNLIKIVDVVGKRYYAVNFDEKLPFTDKSFLFMIQNVIKFFNRIELCLMTFYELYEYLTEIINRFHYLDEIILYSFCTMIDYSIIKVIENRVK